MEPVWCLSDHHHYPPTTQSGRTFYNLENCLLVMPAVQLMMTVLFADCQTDSHKIVFKCCQYKYMLVPALPHFNIRLKSIKWKMRSNFWINEGFLKATVKTFPVDFLNLKQTNLNLYKIFFYHNTNSVWILLPWESSEPEDGRFWMFPGEAHILIVPWLTQMLCSEACGQVSIYIITGVSLSLGVHVVTTLPTHMVVVCLSLLPVENCIW